MVTTSARSGFSLLAAAAAFCLLASCRQDLVITSARPKNSIVVDGHITDWERLISRVQDEPFGIGIANDDSSLYLCLLTEDRRTIRQVIRCGLTIWLESGKSNHNRVGIRFPLGMNNSGEDFRRLREARGDTEEVHRILEESFDAMEFLGPGKHDTVPMKITIAESYGRVRLKAVPSQEKFAYELQLPLREDSASKFAVPAPKDSLITIVLESDGPSGESAEDRAPGNRFGGGEGMETRSGGFGGEHRVARHGGMGMDGDHQEMAEPFTIRLSFKLAPK